MYMPVASRCRNYHGKNWDVRSPLNNPRYDTMTKQGACRTVRCRMTNTRGEAVHGAISRHVWRRGEERHMHSSPYDLCLTTLRKPTT